MTARGAEALIADLERANCLECGQVRSLIAAYREAVARLGECEAARETGDRAIARNAELEAKLAAANERLENNHFFGERDGEMVRIDCEPGSIPDGIEARDETIKLQDARIKRLEAKLAVQAEAGERTREALASLISEIEDIGEHGADYKDFWSICRAIGVGKEALAALAPAQPAETENGK